jgi:hypothetical protein
MQYIQKHCNEDVPFFMEPTTGNWQPGVSHWSTGKVMDEFMATATTSHKFIVKDHIHTFSKHDQHIQNLLLSDSTFKIRLQRRNFAEQVASRYIVWCRNEWHYTEKTVSTDYEQPIPLSADIILRICSFIHAINEQLRETDINFDLDLYYEDVLTSCDLDQSGLLATPKPKNYQELLDFIKFQIEHAWPSHSTRHLRL